jgi:uncharacterized protein with HEPN domain
MKKQPEVFLEHILESITLIEEYVDGKTEEDFSSSSQLQDSVIRRLEVIGEAVKNLPPEVRKTYSDVPWKKIAGLRDVLIHEYFGVDLELTWQVVQNELPVLKKRIMEIRAKM